jgi:hypothetical protein
MSSKALSVRLRELEQFPLEVQIEILRKLTDDDLLNICDAENTLEVCQNKNLWLDVIRRRYGEALYRAARDTNNEMPMMDKFRQIVDLDRISDIALVNACDVANEFIQAACQTPRFKVRTLSVEIGPLSEVVREENIDGIEAYSATGDYEVFNRKYDGKTILSIPLTKFLRESIPVNIDVVRALLDSPFDFQALTLQKQRGMVGDYILQGEDFFDLFEEKGLVSTQSRLSFEKTPLMIVAGKRPEDPTYLRHLLAKDRDVLNVQSKNGSTALMKALSTFEVTYDNARILLSDPNINVDIQTDQGFTVVEQVLNQNPAPPNDVLRMILNKATITPDLIAYANSPEGLELLLNDYGLGDERYQSYINQRYTEAIVDENEDLQRILEEHNAIFALGLLEEETIEEVFRSILRGRSPTEHDMDLYQRILNDESLSELQRSNIRIYWKASYPCIIEIPETFYTSDDVNVLKDIIAANEISTSLIHKRYIFARFRDTPEEQAVAQFLEKTFDIGEVLDWDCITKQEKHDLFYEALERNREDLASLIVENSFLDFELAQALSSYRERIGIPEYESSEDSYSPQKPFQRRFPILLQQLRASLKE